MEREKEIVKLVSVLRRIARAAAHIVWNRVEPDATSFCVSQYNKVLARLSEIEPSVGPAFTALPEKASAEVVRIAARELAAYFEDEIPNEYRGRGCAGRVWVGWAPMRRNW
jgi:hypothetical protein